MNDRCTYFKKPNKWIIRYKNAQHECVFTSHVGETYIESTLVLTGFKPEDKLLLSMCLQLTLKAFNKDKDFIIIKIPAKTCWNLDDMLTPYGFRTLDRTSETIVLKKDFEYNELFTDTRNWPLMPPFPSRENRNVNFIVMNQESHDKLFFSVPDFEDKGDERIFFTGQYNIKRMVPVTHAGYKPGDIVFILRTVNWNGEYNDEITGSAIVTRVFSKGNDYSSPFKFKKIMGIEHPYSPRPLSNMFLKNQEIVELISTSRFQKKNRRTRWDLKRYGMWPSSGYPTDAKLTDDQYQRLLSESKVRNKIIK